MGEILLAIILSLVFLLFLYFPVMGFAYLFLGEFGTGLLYLIPLLCLTCWILYRHFVIEPERTRQDALCRMYSYPQNINKNKTSDDWHNKFKDTIQSGLISCKDAIKKSDLNNCMHVVDNMEKDRIFESFQRAFQLTGCHMEIKDTTDQTITKIV